MEQKFLSVKQAAILIGVSPLTLRNWDKKGHLVAHRNPINNYRVYLVEDVQKILDKMQQAPNQPKRLQVQFLEDETGSEES